MKICSANQRALNIHPIFQLAVAFLLFSETSCGSTKYAYEGPDGCKPSDCVCSTEANTNVNQVTGEVVTTSKTTCYNISSYSGPREFLVRKIQQPVVNGMAKVRGFMADKVNRARSYCQNAQVKENFVKTKDSWAERASELGNKIGNTLDTTKGKLKTYWQNMKVNYFGGKVDNAAV